MKRATIPARLRLPLQVRQRVEDRPGARDAVTLLRELRQPSVPLSLAERNLLIGQLERWMRARGLDPDRVTAKPRRKRKHRVGEQAAEPVVIRARGGASGEVRPAQRAHRLRRPADPRPEVGAMSEGAEFDLRLKALRSDVAAVLGHDPVARAWAEVRDDLRALQQQTPSWLPKAARRARREACTELIGDLAKWATRAGIRPREPKHSTTSSVAARPATSGELERIRTAFELLTFRGVVDPELPRLERDVATLVEELGQRVRRRPNEGWPRARRQAARELQRRMNRYRLRGTAEPSSKSWTDGTGDERASIAHPLAAADCAPVRSPRPARPIYVRIVSGGLPTLGRR
ncbi:hypothetical protein V6N00_12795 [Tersicoccus sp. MR15.9]|uniref:hypothetical protein n=1 Tax=Tersicoccus mangrovi TaxID=3121635 RepID=UPI002FE6576B